MISLDKGVKVAKIAKVREKISDGDKDIDMDDIDDVVINVAKSDEPVVIIHDEVDVDDLGDYVGETEVIENGVFKESKFRSAPYFDLIIDGITNIIEKK